MERELSRTELEIRLAEAERELAGSRSRRGGRGQRARRILVAVLVVLGTVLGLAGNLVSWIEVTLLDTDTWVETVEPLPSDPAIAEALSVFLVDELFRTVDLEERISAALPDQASFLAGPLSSALRSYAVDVAADMLASEQFSRIWTETNRTAHGLLVRALEGGGENVAVEEGQVTVDLRPAVTALAERLGVDLAGLLERVEVPEDAGRFTVLESEQLGSVQEGVDLLHTLNWFVPVLAVAAWVLALVLSRDRRRTVLGIGIGLVVVTLATGLVLDLVRSRTLDRISDPGRSDAAASFWDLVLRGFISQNRALFALGAVLVVGAYLVGPGRSATWLRVRARRGAEGIDGQLEDRPGWLAALTGFARRHQARLVAGVVVAGMVLLVVWDRPTGRVVVAVAAGVMVAVLGVELAAALGEREAQRAGVGSRTAGQDTGAEAPAGSAAPHLEGRRRSGGS